MKKGFTLIEMIGVIAILAVLSLILVPKAISIIKENNEKIYHEAEKRMEEAALKFLINHYDDDEIIRVSKNDLVASSLIEEVLDLTDKSVCDGYVLVTNDDLSTAKAYISCTNYETEGYVH